MSPSASLLQKIREGLSVGRLDSLIADSNPPIDLWAEALKGYQRYVKLIALWISKRKK